MSGIAHQVAIHANPAEVYTALTTAAGIRRWWTVDADLDEQVGGKGIFRFNYEGIVETKVRILKLQSPALVVWAVESSFRPEQNATIINFELRPEDDGTDLRFSQTGFQIAGETFELLTEGWWYYLVSMKRYLELGQGAPSPDLDWTILD